MKRNFLLSVVFALAAALFCVLYLNDINRKNKSVSDPVRVVVASSKIEQGKIITSDLIKEITVPKQYVQPKYISSADDFYENGNPAYMSIVGFENGEQITSGKISPVSSDAGISNTVPTDKRAVTVVFSREEIAGIVSPGSRIDLIAVTEYENKDGISEEASFVVAQNLLVLAVGNKTIGNISSQEEQVLTVSLPVTVAASLSEAQTIMLAQETGTIKVLLRPSADVNIDNSVKPVKFSDVFKETKYTQKTKSNNDAKLLREMQKKQKEVAELINKYSSK